MQISNQRLTEIIIEEIQRMAVPPPIQAQPVSAQADVKAQPERACAAPEAQPCAVKQAACKRVSPEPSDALRRMQASTAARIGIGRCGPRMRTKALLDFRADHAAAKDAVTQDVDEELLARLGLFSVQTQCRDMNEYLTRPDLGRLLCPDAEQTLKQRCAASPTVQIFAAGGLSSVAIQANLENILPVLNDSLGARGTKTGTPFYVKYGRVGVEDAVSVLLGAEVVCLLVGERPGLMSAESMSAYIAYRATPDMPESRRTVVSNIHRGGTGAAEAGAYIADIIEKILKAGVSGVELRR